MDYLQYQILAADEWREVLLAWLSRLPFESFEEVEAGFHAYLPVADRTPEIERELEKLRRKAPFEWQVVHLAHRNWNEVWETNFNPIRVGSFCGVRADFHPPPEGVAHDLIIRPKMAFGTGHHATTYLMIEQMEAVAWTGKRVLDYGCGTGILAILAARLGASLVEAVDIEEAAWENTLENAALNGVEEQLRVHQGTLDAVTGEAFDFILANINRNVILSSLPALYQKLPRPGGLLISGILTSDEPLVLARASDAGFQQGERREREGWACRWLWK